MAEPTVDRHASGPYAYLTTTGRVTGRPHEIEIWFAARGNTLYLMNGGGGRRPPGAADWVQNLRRDPHARVRIGDEQYSVRARFVVIDSEEHELARTLLVAKYASGPDDLSHWRRTAFPVALEVEA